MPRKGTVDYKAKLKEISTYCETMAGAYDRIGNANADSGLLTADHRAILKGAIDAYLDIAQKISAK